VEVGGVVIKLLALRKHVGASVGAFFRLEVFVLGMLLPWSGGPPAAAHPAIEHLSDPKMSLIKVHRR